MKRKKKLTSFIQKKVYLREVARHLGVSKSTAHNWIKEIEEKKKQSQNILDRLISQLGQDRKELAKYASNKKLYRPNASNWTEIWTKMNRIWTTCPEFKLNFII